MTNKINKILMIIMSLSSITSCNKEKEEKTMYRLLNAQIAEDYKFNSAVVNISIEDFNNLGFSLGDSLNVKFSNGYTLEDVPYYNGYYVKTASPVVVAYPSSEYIIITLNNYGIWGRANLSESYTVDITLNEAKKYLVTQEALNQSYSLRRTDYASDEEFSNFRSLVGGSLKDNLIYRGASPVDNSRNRATCTDTLLEKNNINCIIDLADSSDNMESYLADYRFNSNYTKSIYDEGKMILLSMSSSYVLDAYKQSVVKGLRHLLNFDGPYYIHCMEGKDRTGFVCTLIEALAGASYDQMCKDYMKTYENYYHITQEDTPEKYEAIKTLYFDSFMECFNGSNDLKVLKLANYVDAAKQYLRDGGMDDEEIEELILKITK